jgi:hypothetical protein
MKLGRIGAFLVTAIGLCLPSLQVEAHWCDDLWGSAYNLVVRPESDTVTVPSSGSASLVVYVQNNMSYLLPNFELGASANSADITATRSGAKVSGTLLPGERGKFTLKITMSGGGSINATDIDFSVRFGTSYQSNNYAFGDGKAAMIRKTDGSLSPTPPPPGLGDEPGYHQSAQLIYSAVADYGTTSEGMDLLLQLYCAGRGSWNSGSFQNIRSSCPNVSTTVCPSTVPGAGGGDKFMYPRLWAVSHLAVRKSALGDRLGQFRQRLMCGANDGNLAFAGFALMALGYLGEDAEARAFLEGKASGSGDIATVAKAALLLMGNADDLTKHKAAVTAGAGSSSVFVKAPCAAALGIAAKDDAIVNSALIPLAKWSEPDEDDGAGLYPSALLHMVAMDRRGWAARAGDSGLVSFYGETGSGGGGNPGGTGGSPGTGGRPGTGGSPGAGGRPGVGGTTGNRNGGAGGRSGTGGSVVVGSKGGRTGTVVGTGGSVIPGGVGGGPVVGVGGNSSGRAGALGFGGGTGVLIGLGGSTGVTPVGGNAGTPQPPLSTGGIQAPGGQGGVVLPGVDGGAGPTAPASKSGGGCNIGAPARTEPLSLLAIAGLAFLIGRRRRR